MTTSRFKHELTPYARLIALLIDLSHPQIQLATEEYERLAQRHLPLLEAGIALEAPDRPLSESEIRDRQIIRLRIGLDDPAGNPEQQGLTHGVIAARFAGIGRERVRQREAKGLDAIASRLRAAGVDLARAGVLRPQGSRARIPEPVAG